MTNLLHGISENDEKSDKFLALNRYADMPITERNMYKDEISNVMESQLEVGTGRKGTVKIKTCNMGYAMRNFSTVNGVNPLGRGQLTRESALGFMNRMSPRSPRPRDVVLASCVAP